MKSIKKSCEVIKKHGLEVFIENIFNFLPLFILVSVKIFYRTIDFKFISNSNFMLIIMILWSNFLLKLITFEIKIIKEEKMSSV